MSLNAFLRKQGGAVAGISCALIGIWLGFPNDLFECPPLALLWPFSLIWLGENSNSGKDAFFQGWLATLCGSVCALYWLSMPVHYVGALPWPLAALCAVFIAAILSLQGGVFCFFCRFIRQAPLFRKILLAGLFWYLLEFAFALAAGFPWLPLAGAFCVWPVMVQIVDFSGAYAAGAIWLCALLPAVFAFNSLNCGRKRKFVHVGISVCFVMLILAYGLWRLGENPVDVSPQGPDAMQALFVEGNVDQNQKWVPAFQRQTLELYLRLTAQGMEQAGRAGIGHPLIIWPETAMPFFFEARPLLAGAVTSCAAKYDCPLLFGAPGLERAPDLPEGAVFNRAFLIGPGGTVLGHYDKMHLVPFGEYLPSWLKIDFLEALLQGVGIYQEGNDPSPLKYGRLALGMLICYEGIFPWLARERVSSGANILVDISNDGWFGLTPACRQHLYLTVLRCLEQNRWLLRATNTGISAVADPRGRITMRGPQFQEGFLIARARILQEKSIYYMIEPWLPFAALSLLGILLLMENKNRFYIKE